ncbi:hypothetical protein SAMN05216436_12745 [bacterium A37T11]|nr:hypothetical protein SAMN05216436_12745 [bacterium A37T11]
MKNLFKLAFLGVAITLGAASCGGSGSTSTEATTDSIESSVDSLTDATTDTIDSIGSAVKDTVDSAAKAK